MTGCLYARRPSFLLAILTGLSPFLLYLFIVCKVCEKFNLSISSLVGFVSHFSFFIEVSFNEQFCKRVGAVTPVLMSQWPIAVLFFFLSLSQNGFLSLVLFFCCKYGSHSSHNSWSLLCRRYSVAWTHLKFFPKLVVFKFYHNQMINTLPDWESPWLIVWFYRVWGKRMRLRGSWNGLGCALSMERGGMQVHHRQVLWRDRGPLT